MLFVFGRIINKVNVNVKPVVQQDYYYKHFGVCVLAEFKNDFRLKWQKEKLTRERVTGVLALSLL